MFKKLCFFSIMSMLSAQAMDDYSTPQVWIRKISNQTDFPAKLEIGDTTLLIDRRSERDIFLEVELLASCVGNSFRKQGALYVNDKRLPFLIATDRDTFSAKCMPNRSGQTAAYNPQGTDGIYQMYGIDFVLTQEVEGIKVRLSLNATPSSQNSLAIMQEIYDCQEIINRLERADKTPAMIEQIWREIHRSVSFKKFEHLPCISPEFKALTTSITKSAVVLLSEYVHLYLANWQTMKSQFAQSQDSESLAKMLTIFKQMNAFGLDKIASSTLNHEVAALQSHINAIATSSKIIDPITLDEIQDAAADQRITLDGQQFLKKSLVLALVQQLRTRKNLGLGGFLNPVSKKEIAQETIAALFAECHLATQEIMSYENDSLAGLFKTVRECEDSLANYESMEIDPHDAQLHALQNQVHDTQMRLDLAHAKIREKLHHYCLLES